MRKRVNNRESSSDVLSAVNRINDRGSIITVVGVGGAGGNAVNYMHKMGIDNVEFLACNTDIQALNNSPVKNKLCLGNTGLGAGNDPSVGREKATESLDSIRDEFIRLNTKMVFFTAGMGGGTGTGATPVIAKLAKEMDILSVGIVTLPLEGEGKYRCENAEAGVAELKKYVDSLLIIRNDNISKLYKNISVKAAFIAADEILNNAVKGIAEIITNGDNDVNVDFADVRKVLKDSGRAHLGLGSASGDGRALAATKNAMASTLLDKNNIAGAKDILLHISIANADELPHDELKDILKFLQDSVGVVNDEGVLETASIIWGYGERPDMEDRCEVVLVATNFNSYALEESGQIQGSATTTLSGSTSNSVASQRRSTASVANGEEVILPERTIRYPNIDAMLQFPSYRKSGAKLITEEQMNEMIHNRKMEEAHKNGLQ